MPPAPPDDIPPFRKHPISDSAKGWTGILAGIAGIITAAAAFQREPEEKAARQSYEVLSQRLEEVVAVQRQLQEDVREQGEWLANLRGYVQGIRSEPLEPQAPRMSSRRSMPRPDPDEPADAPDAEGVRVLPPPPKPKSPSIPDMRLPSFEQIQRTE